MTITTYPKTQKDRESRKSEMMKLRLPPNSWTIQMIADHFKITKQRVQQIIGRTSRYGSAK